MDVNALIQNASVTLVAVAWKVAGLLSSVRISPELSKLQVASISWIRTSDPGPPDPGSGLF
jgi:hypothetical protein